MTVTIPIPAKIHCCSCGFMKKYVTAHTMDRGARDSASYMCDDCFNRPEIFHIEKYLNRFGSLEKVAEHFWREQLGIKPGQSTFGSVIPDFVRRRLSL